MVAPPMVCRSPKLTTCVSVVLVALVMTTSGHASGNDNPLPVSSDPVAEFLANLHTHGPDPVPDDDTLDTIDLTDATGPTCVHDPLNDHYAQLVLMDPLPSLPGSVSIDMVRNLAIVADELLAREARLFGHDVHIKVLCDDDGLIDVKVVPVSVDSPTSDYLALVLQMRAQGFALPNVHYWVYYDGYVPGIGGQASAPIDPDPGLNEGGNRGPQYSFTYGYRSPKIMLHELTHNMGGVSYQSPNTSGGAHCNDGRDVMCYSDGGWNSRYTSGVCPAREVYDCNHDDYFHPKPPQGNYLWDHWNIASPLNLFIDHPQACQWDRGVIADPGATVTIPLIADCGGRFFTLDNDPPHRILRDHLPDVDLCFQSGGVDLECHTGDGRERGTIPHDADAVRIWVDDPATGGAWAWQPN